MNPKRCINCFCEFMPKRKMQKLCSRRCSGSYTKSGIKHHNFGKELSQETKNKISYANKGKTIVLTKETIEKIRVKAIGRIKTPEHRLKLSLALKGRPHSQQRLDAISYGLSNSRSKKIITIPERLVKNAYEYFGLKYVGDGTYWLTFLDGKKKNPDFIVPNHKIAIEVFGDYWHRGEDKNSLIEKYKTIGWRCLILWETEIKKDTDLIETINKFINYDNYEPFTDQSERHYAERYIIR